MLLASLLAKSIVAKAALATATLSVTGAAVAAGTGALPASVQQIAHEYVGAPAPAASTAEATPEPSGDPTTEPSDTPGAEPTEQPTSEPTDEPTTDPSKGPGGPDATGRAGFGLCRAYLNHGRKNGDPAWQALVTAAGGADKVAAYCQSVVTAKKSEHPKATPAPHTTGTSGTGHGVKPAPAAKPTPTTGDHHGKPTPAAPSSKGSKGKGGSGH